MGEAERERVETTIHDVEDSARRCSRRSRWTCAPKHAHTKPNASAAKRLRTTASGASRVALTGGRLFVVRADCYQLVMPYIRKRIGKTNALFKPRAGARSHGGAASVTRAARRG
jgi:hypothetical protein